MSPPEFEAVVSGAWVSTGENTAEKLAFWLAVKVYSSLLLTLTPFEYQPSNLYPSSALAIRVTFLPFSYLPSPSASPPPLELVLIIQREAVVCLVV